MLSNLLIYPYWTNGRIPNSTPPVEHRRCVGCSYVSCSTIAGLLVHGAGLVWGTREGLWIVKWKKRETWKRKLIRTTRIRVSMVRDYPNFTKWRDGKICPNSDLPKSRKASMSEDVKVWMAATGKSIESFVNKSIQTFLLVCRKLRLQPILLFEI